MAGLRLRDRYMGSELCRFERSLMSDPSNRDVGFVSFIDRRSFRLLKSRFTDIDSGRVYVLPSDLSAQVIDGELIRAVPSRILKRVVIPGNDPGRLSEAVNMEVVDVLSLERPRVPIPPPLLPKDEFMAKVSSAWSDPDKDMLDLVIALLLVSAPSSVYGRGGLGSEGLETPRAPDVGTPRDLAQTVTAQLPVEFRTSGTQRYRFLTVDSLKDLIEVQTTRVEENCFSIVRPHKVSETMRSKKVPIQLPFVLRDSRLKGKRPELDLDVLDYQLTALYTPPPTDDQVRELSERALKEAFTDAFWDAPSIGEPDPLGAVRIALALTRLNIGKQFTGEGYMRKRTDVSSDGFSVFKELLSRGLEEKGRMIREEDAFRRDRTFPWRSKLKPMDRRIYMELREAAERDGTFDFDRGSIMPGADRRQVEEALDRLNRYGYVLFMKGGTVVKVVVSTHPEA
ncbi:MAG: hypothetical protein MUC62_05680 [Candidatus Thermoplasmatota archaeon]|jgi:hypothetical protein|nr:hypothetical protein [Candidatus Thermoplasmatota archaeon]